MIEHKKDVGWKAQQNLDELSKALQVALDASPNTGQINSTKQLWICLSETKKLLSGASLQLLWSQQCNIEGVIKKLQELLQVIRSAGLSQDNPTFFDFRPKVTGGHVVMLTSPTAMADTPAEGH